MGRSQPRAESLRVLEHEVGVLIRRVKRVIAERARAVHPDLQPASYLMLGYVAEHGPVRASAVADVFAIDKGAVSRQVTHLVDLGLMRGEPDPADRRATLLSLTDDAFARLEEIKRHRRKLVDEQLGGWSADELERFAADLARYNDALEALNAVGDSRP
jgi:DNA-binding MarR family transcriptional regulator